MDIQLDLDIHGSYPPSTSSWMWSVLSMDIQLDIHPLPSLMVAMKRKYKNLELESRGFHDLVQALIDRPRQEAIFILDHMRRTRDVALTLAFIKDGDLLTWGRNVHGANPSDFTTTLHDSVRDITHGVNLMNGQDDRSVDSNESIPEPSNSPKRRIAISDLVDD
jgi:hypothetical protein